MESRCVFPYLLVVDVDGTHDGAKISLRGYINPKKKKEKSPLWGETILLFKSNISVMFLYLGPTYMVKKATISEPVSIGSV